VPSLEVFRKALRRSLAEGHAVLRLQRGDRTIELKVKLVD
jgi:hypothetical protein